MSLHFLHKYRELLKSYLHGPIDTATFSSSYLATFTGETSPMTVQPYDMLNHLFGIVERYCPDPSLRDREDADEAEVRQAAEETLCKLDHLLRNMSEGKEVSAIETRSGS